MKHLYDLQAHVRLGSRLSWQLICKNRSFDSRHFFHYLFFIFIPSHIYARVIFNGPPEMNRFSIEKSLSSLKK
jgi:hypothetical protein